MECLNDVYESFFGSQIVSISHFGDGHVNDTYLVKTGQGSFVCQQVRRDMDKALLERNYLSYAHACENEEWLYPVWLKSSSGSFFYEDGKGENWRAYPLLGGDVKVVPLTREEFSACGQGLAREHALLQRMEKPSAVWPELHDLRAFRDRYERLLATGEFFAGRRDVSVEERIRDGVERRLELNLDRSKVVHGDPKLANILFRGGKVVGFLDLDTIMMGSLTEDIADCMRSCCVMEGKPDGEAMKHFLEGYLQEENGLLTEREISLLPKVFGKICFELALRYYTDAIAQKKKFKEKYPGYLLEKAKYNLMISERAEAEVWF